MVTRKPVPHGSSGLAPTSVPPYPITPTSTTTPTPFRQDANNQEPEDASNPWTGEDLDKLSLHGGRGRDAPESSLPSSLRVGPPAGYTPKSSQERLVQPQTTNPFILRQQTGSSNQSRESSADAWKGSEKSIHHWDGLSDLPTQPTGAPPPPPVPKAGTPPQQPSRSYTPESNTNPWGQTSDGQPLSKPMGIPPIPQEDSGSNAWDAPPPARQAPTLPSVDTTQPALIDLEEPESPAWDEDEPSPVVHEMPANNTEEVQQLKEDRHAWDENQGHPLQQNPPNPTITTQLPSPEQQGEGWNIIDHDSVQGGAQQSGVVTGSGAILERFSEPEPPALPPRRSQDEPPPQPPRPILDTSMNQSSTSVMSPGGAAKRQKKETYEIKKITWHDVRAAKNPRISPILVQNANGPCPLLALVNALTLSTPAELETALVETLRTREQVSLGLLLDAVFDELMSGRRGDAAQELPDVSDLYSFLITLHTGMNVNPRFFPNPPTRKSTDPRNSMSHVHPSERESNLPGAFEETREMKLYSTFSIPLIHGWIPEKESPAFFALERSAKSYEDAQNLMFHEEELEYKLQREGLSFQEQGTLEDIATIKAFFASNATQLTPYGLNTITGSLAPASVAILFRNDHFSTLYRHPDTLQLLQLVTDMGYAGHEEVVWESLIDVTGENAEFFSGDFRLVGGAPATPSAAYQNPNDGWTPVPGRRTSSQNQTGGGGHQYNNSASSQHPPQSPNIEQEDHDLALALQLQEEEEERHRAELARRQRETELSQQYIEQQGRANNNVPVSQRGGGRRQSSANTPNARGRGRGSVSAPAPAPVPEPRPNLPARRPNAGGQPIDPEAGVDAPPPSYEQAAHQAAYVPPENHPAHPNASPNASLAGGRRTSAYTANSSYQQQQQQPEMRPMGRRATGPSGGGTLVDQIPGGYPGSNGNGRRNTSQGGGEGGGKDKDCIVM